MLLLFRRNDGVGLIILVFVAFILRLAYFVNPPEITELGDFYTNTFGRYNWLKNFYLSLPRLYIFVSTIFWLLFGIFLKYSIVNEKLVKYRDYTPAIALFMITSALPPFMIISVAGVSACLIFVSLSIALGAVYNKPARSRYFLVGFFLGLATALYWPAGIAFFAILIALLSIRIFVAQEILALLLGMIFPLYLVFTIHYIATGHAVSPDHLILGIELPTAMQHVIGGSLLSVMIVVLTFYGLYISRSKIIENKIQIAKKWNGVVLVLIAGIIIGLTTRIFPSNQFNFVLIPFSIILSSALINNHKKYNTFTFYFVLLVVLALQWVLRFI